ncbi:T9SS type A sorting domain-containing protein [Flavobacterium psychrophilum]|nr:T9SS type A sorting domain-containing protein [Flavobacterium psychrophilum]
MKNIYFLILSLNFFNAFSQTEVNVMGIPICGTSISSSVPANYDGFAGYKSWAGMIYNSSSINQTGLIKSISFAVDCTSYACNFLTASNQKIYIAEVNYSSFASNTKPDLSSFTKVFEGDITWSRGGYAGGPVWHTINLSTPFNYTGTKNLLIYFENNNNGVLGGVSCGTKPLFLVESASARASIYSNFNTVPSTTGSYSNQVPYLKLTFKNNLSIKTFDANDGFVVFIDNNNSMNISINSLIASNASLIISAMTGQVLVEKVFFMQEGKNDIVLSNALAKGFYIAQIKIGDRTTTAKFYID